MLGREMFCAEVFCAAAALAASVVAARNSRLERPLPIPLGMFKSYTSESRYAILIVSHCEMMRTLQLAFFLPLLANSVVADEVALNGAKFSLEALLFEDNFDHGLANWSAELEGAGPVDAKAGVMEVNVPAGATIWFRHILTGPLLIQYDATVLQAAGANDRVSDLNCFRMATDSRSPDDLFRTPRSGKFADYNKLKTYYVGQGGNDNTTTRFRRYIGEQDSRPLLPEHDLSGKQFLLVPNAEQKIQLIAADNRIGYLRDGSAIFDFNDPDPYTSGYFGFRTMHSHIQLRHFRVYRLRQIP